MLEPIPGENKEKHIAFEGRTSKGTFAKGNKITPANGYQYQSERIKSIEKLYTAQQILEIAADPKKLYDRNPRDAMIIAQLARAMSNIEATTCQDVARERETLLDRVEGKSKNSDGSVTVGIVQIVLEAGKLKQGEQAAQVEQEPVDVTDCEETKDNI